MKGKVAWFSNGKGFGFLIPDGGGKDIFAHFSEIQQDGYKSMAQDDEVSFEIGEKDGRTVATNIVITKEARNGR